MDKKKIAKTIGDWVNTPVGKQFNKEYFKYLRKYVSYRRTKTTIFPKKGKVFRALRACPFSELKVVILGQDPYPNEKANGLAFSNDNYQNISPSLKNIFKEVENDVGFSDPQPDPDLSRWAEQGVLLLNTVLTVEEGNSNAHSRIPLPDGSEGALWQRFTETVIKTCSYTDKTTVFLLWGNQAQSYVDKVPPTIDPLKEGNWVLRSYHPSPLSAYRGFFGNNHFSQTNEILRDNNLEPIEW